MCIWRCTTAARVVVQVRAAGGASGMHVMPITQAAKKMALQLLEEGAMLRPVAAP